MTIDTLSIGRPQIVLASGRQYSTSIHRKPVAGPVLLTPDGFAGDRVSSDSVHGGPDKAALCFSREHYPHYEQKLGRTLDVPAFGENLTTRGWTEELACIGDILRIGNAVVQVSQPRQPCYKLADKHAEPRLIEWVHAAAWAGFYIRVRTPGEIAAGDSITLVERPHPDFPMPLLSRSLRENPPNVELLSAIAALPELAESWRTQIEKRLHPDPQ